MKVVKVTGILPKRDAYLSEIPKDFFKDISLRKYEHSTSMKVHKQEGYYRSIQGASITPAPFWTIEFCTSVRKIGEDVCSIPITENNLYKVRTARWASDVIGGGTEKKNGEE